MRRPGLPGEATPPGSSHKYVADARTWQQLDQLTAANDRQASAGPPRTGDGESPAGSTCSS